jgi:hypothetical protein
MSAVALSLRACLCWPVLFAVLVPGAALAQHITIDGTLSPARTLAGPRYLIGANLGRQVGGNLFESFGIFGSRSRRARDLHRPGLDRQHHRPGDRRRTVIDQRRDLLEDRRRQRLSDQPVGRGLRD